jgi:hypothetical protein
MNFQDNRGSLGFDHAVLTFCKAAHQYNPLLWVDIINSDVTPLLTAHQLLNVNWLDALCMQPVCQFAETMAAMLYCPDEGEYPEGFLEMLSAAEHATLACAAPLDNNVSYEDIFVEWAQQEFIDKSDNIYTKAVTVLMGTVHNKPARHPRDVVINKLTEVDEPLQLTPYFRIPARKMAEYIHESWMRSDRYAELVY